MLFGALISPTDPIAVLAIMKSVAAPKQWEVQMSGESLFNDGIGVVIFLVLLELSGGGSGASGHAVHLSTTAMILLKEVGGALVLGLVAGMIAFRMLKRVDNYQVEVLLTLALAMGGYALADALHLSAPITVVVSGVFIGNEGRAFAMSDKTQEHVDTFWELIDEILNTVLFPASRSGTVGIAAGMEMARRGAAGCADRGVGAVDQRAGNGCPAGAAPDPAARLDRGVDVGRARGAISVALRSRCRRTIRGACC